MNVVAEENEAVDPAELEWQVQPVEAFSEWWLAWTTGSGMSVELPDKWRTKVEMLSGRLRWLDVEQAVRIAMEKSNVQPPQRFNYFFGVAVGMIANRRDEPDLSIPSFLADPDKRERVEAEKLEAERRAQERAAEARRAEYDRAAERMAAEAERRAHWDEVRSTVTLIRRAREGSKAHLPDCRYAKGGVEVTEALDIEEVCGTCLSRLDLARAD